MRGYEKSSVQKKSIFSTANSGGSKAIQKKAVSVIQKAAPEEEQQQHKSDGTVRKAAEPDMEEKPLGVTHYKISQQIPTVVQLMVDCNHLSHDLSHTVVAQLNGWIFESSTQTSVDLIKLRFRHTADQSVCVVHYHPGSHYPTAVEDENGRRLHDSCHKFNQELATAAQTHIDVNRVEAPQSRQPTSTQEIRPLAEQQELIAAARSLGSAAYRPGAMRQIQPPPPPKLAANE
jgi:hypothetical protein